jgi:hypothetical protein
MQMRTLILSVIAINELGGSILGRLALVRAGEVGKGEYGEEEGVSGEQGPPRRTSGAVAESA